MSRQSGGASPPRELARVRQAISSVELDDLRDLRNSIRTDIERVSYWVRLLESRIDTLAADKHIDAIPGRILTVTSYQTVAFSESMSYKGRMPEPAESWTRASHRLDATEIAAMRTQMAEYVQMLQQYRLFLKQRLDIVTEELIERYRDDPSLIETLIPVREQQTLDDRTNGL